MALIAISNVEKSSAVGIANIVIQKTKSAIVDMVFSGSCQGMMTGTALTEKGERMPKHITVDELKEWIENWFYVHRNYHPYSKSNDIPVPELYDILEQMPTADVVERKKGKWTEKEVIHAEEAKEVITEWQSCRCSVCGRYHTQPYMYYFDNPNYCDFCGAKMDGKETEDE